LRDEQLQYKEKSVTLDDGKELLDIEHEIKAVAHEVIYIL